MRTLKLSLLLFCLSGYINNIAAEPANNQLTALKIQIVTEDHRPYSYLENGKIIGSATQIVTQVLQQADIEFTIEQLPWARAFSKAKSEANTLIYPITRTQEREDRFHWVGEVMPVSRWYFYKQQQRSDIVINDLEDAKKYSVAVHRDSDKHSFLTKHNFQKIILGSQQTQLVELLTMNRVDVLLLNEHTMKAYLKSTETPNVMVVQAFKAKESRAYMAFSKETEHQIFERAKGAYLKLQDVLSLQ